LSRWENPPYTTYITIPHTEIMNGSQTTAGYMQPERSRIIKNIAQWRCELKFD